VNHESHDQLIITWVRISSLWFFYPYAGGCRPKRGTDHIYNSNQQQVWYQPTYQL